MKKTIKQINDAFKLTEKPLLFELANLYPYPTIPDDDHNFIEDYNDNAAVYDNYFVKEYGERVVEYDVTSDTEFYAAWCQDLFGTELIYLDAWARLYYAININYNPVYNVEENTKTTYGQHETDFLNAQRQHTKGQQIDTVGGGTDTSTTANVATDSAEYKDSAKQTDVIAQRQNTEGQRIDTESTFTDTTTSKQHIDTVERSGNIGVVSATELLNQEIEQKKRLSFFRNIFLILVEEVGAYYEFNFLQ